MSEWIECDSDGVQLHPDTLIEIEYEAVRSTRLVAGTNWAGARRYRVVRPAPSAEDRIAALERRVEEIERKQSVRVVAPAPVWAVKPGESTCPPYTGEPYTVGVQHPSFDVTATLTGKPNA